MPVPTDERNGHVALHEEALRADLTYIASDKFGGRMSLEAGDDLAIEWIADQFAKAGLKPAATDSAGKSSFLQSFELIEYRPDRVATALEIDREYPAGGRVCTSRQTPKGMWVEPTWPCAYNAPTVSMGAAKELHSNA